MERSLVEVTQGAKNMADGIVVVFGAVFGSIC